MPPKKKGDEKAGYSVELRFGRTKANLKMGIVGLPNVGKSSFFNLLTKQTAEAANYPFCTINPNEGRCQINDDRYDKLCEMWKPKSKIPAYLNLTDIAGLVKGAHAGEGLGNAFLSHIQAIDGIYHMVRIFENDEVTHVDDCVDPVRDMETITNELCLKDMAYFTAIMEDAEKKAKRANKKMPEPFVQTMEKVKELLEKNQLLSRAEWTAIQVEIINENLPTLITTKPMIYLLNLTEKAYMTKKNKWLSKVVTWINEHGGGTILPLSVEFEERLFEARDNPDVLAAIKEEGPNAVTCLPKIIRAGFTDLNLLNFFTTGEDEVRAWTVYKGATAPQAAGAIHGDFEKCFIKSETCSYEDFIKSTPEDGKKCSMAGVKAAGKYRIEGKAYIVQDGDILHIMHNARR